MRFDPTGTAAVYGLFQLVFANMTYEFARALFALRSRHDPELKWKDIPWQFDRMVRELKKELDQLEEHCFEKDSLAEVRQMCIKAKELAPWRDSRVHAIVQQVDDGLALFDWKTGKRLAITAEECERKMNAAAVVVCNLPVHMGYLIRDFDSRAAIRDLFASLDETAIAECRRSKE